METGVQKKGRPFGFYVCSMGFTFERLSFYTVKYILAMWVAADVLSGGLGMGQVKATAISAGFVAWTYITPMFGGYIADHWVKPRWCVLVGMILMGIGYMIAWKATSLTLVYVMFVFVAVGTGLFKGNLSGITGQLFNSAEQLDSAFSIQYTFVNIGSFIGTTFIAPLATTGMFGVHVTYRTIFLITGIFLFIDAIWFFVVGGKALGEAGMSPFKKDQREFISAEKKESEESAPLTTGDKKRVAAVLLVIIFSMVFWMLWYLTYYPAYFRFGWGDGAEYLNKANWVIGGFKVPTSWFDSVNALTCVVLGPILAGVWLKLAKRPQGDLSMYKKTALGCGLLGLAYFVMVFANSLAGENGQCSVLWIGLVCIMMSVGEMVFSPLGNSFINKLAPAKLLGLLLGTWPVAVFISQFIYPKIYAWTLTQDFGFAYGLLGGIVIVFGVVLWILSKKLDSWAEQE